MYSTISKVLILACTFLVCINGAATNLVANSGFDEARPDCFTPPSWSQFSSSNQFSTCPSAPYHVVSAPYGAYLTGQGWAGAVQDIQINLPTSIPTFSFSSSVWLVSCSQQTCYTTIGWLGVTFNLTYTDGTTTVVEFAIPHSSSSVEFVLREFTFTPTKPVSTVRLALLMDGNDQAMSMWDDVSLTVTSTTEVSTPTTAPATEAPVVTSTPTIPPAAPSTPTTAPSTPTTAPSTPTTAPSTPTIPPAVPSTPTSAPSNPTSSPSNPTSAPSTTEAPATPTSSSEPAANPTSSPSTSTPNNENQNPNQPDEATSSASSLSATLIFVICGFLYL